MARQLSACLAPQSAALAPSRAAARSAGTGTLRAAAEQLGITQPAATVMLKELEAAVGVSLFEREGRGLRATPRARR